MSSRLSGRLDAERRRRFVGRTAERDLFSAAISSTGLPFNVLYVYGPGGVGKTTLLKGFAHDCRGSGFPATYVDARDLEPSPDAFLGALREALGPTVAGSPFRILEPTKRRVLLVDTCEKLAPLDAWMSDEFLPQLPDELLLVVADRNPPSERWRTSPGWGTLVRQLALRNLSREEGREYLEKREVPPEHHRSILEFTHGHPLALSLVADVVFQRDGSPFRPEDSPDVIGALLKRFVRQVPGPDNRTALESCALVRHTNETLLAHLVARDDVHDLFAWLRGLTFIESGPSGLFPHDVAREALVADLHWRDPERYAELHNRARLYYGARIRQTTGREQQRILLDYVYLHRDNPTIRPFLEWQETGSARPDSLRESDKPMLEALVAEHEGTESARLAARWFERQPEGVVIYRDAETLPAGFLLRLGLGETDAADLTVDPAVEAVSGYLQRRVSLRPGEKATLFRFWMARDAYQAVSAMQSLLFVHVAQYYLTTPSLAFTFFPVVDPEFWAPAFAFFDLQRLPEADFEVGGRRYGVYGHDWRVTPPVAWLDLLARRENPARPLAAAKSLGAAPLAVLGEAEFVAAVREALRNLHREDVLRQNLLLRSRVVIDRAGAGAGEADRATALRDLIEEATGTLGASPREVRYQRALDRTYLRPAPSQEKAAEILDLPFSTYRRHLKSGIERVAKALWQGEIGASDSNRG